MKCTVAAVENAIRLALSIHFTESTLFSKSNGIATCIIDVIHYNQIHHRSGQQKVLIYYLVI